MENGQTDNTNSRDVICEKTLQSTNSFDKFRRRKGKHLAWCESQYDWKLGAKCGALSSIVGSKQ